MRPSFFAALMLLVSAAPSIAEGPIKLLAENPRYFEYDGKPTLLITSAEHYGAVLNLDIDYRAYLDELRRSGMNHTRTFSGTYRETPGSFNIRENVLAPLPGRFISPWARVTTAGGTEKFDLDKFDDDYFDRLKDFMSYAAERGVVVEFNLFCVLYDDGLWKINPMNAANNVNGVGACPRGEVLTLKHDDLTAKQLAFVKKAVAELNEFDNLYFEICNEPYFGATPEWQAKVAATIVEAEKDLPKKHLIAQNFANDKGKVEKPDPNVSLFNFHYAVPEAVTANAGLKVPIGDNETGFKGTGDRVYRTQAWEFLLAGGALFNNLDYSFTPGTPDGKAEVKDPTPGGGGRAFRRQMAVLAAALGSCEFWKMKPAPEILEGGSLAEGARTTAFGRPGEYLIYIDRGPKATLALKLPPGRYTTEWIDPRNGESLARGEAALSGDDAVVTLESPTFAEDAAIKIRAR